MHHRKLLRLFSALALLVFALVWAHAAAVAQQSWGANVPMAASQQDGVNPHPTDLANQLPDAKTFAGKVIRSGNKLALQDSIGESTYQIDDQSKARAFEGQDVRVTGTVDVMNNMARIVKIEREP
jgi:hypothetical protein